MGLLRSMHGRDEKCIQNIYRKTRMEESLGRPRRRCEDIIRIDLSEIEWVGVD